MIPALENVLGEHDRVEYHGTREDA